MNSSSLSVSKHLENFPPKIEDATEKEMMVFENVDRMKIFETILRKSLNDDTIRDVKILNKRLACSKGQNFLSQLWKFSLHYTCSEKIGNSFERITKVVDLILKEEPEPGYSLDFIRKNDIFNVELLVFENILPILERLVGKQVAPRFFCGSICPPMIILEDLSSCGFENMCRQRGLPKHHMLKAIEGIAQFHAASVAFNEKQPGYLQHIRSTPFSNLADDSIFDFFEFILQQISDEIRNWPEPWALRASEKLNLFSTHRERLSRIFEYDDNEFCVLNHGDCWITNFMFRENKYGKPVEVRLLDYQMTVWTSPSFDLLYFLSICPEFELKVDYDDYFLEAYLNILSTTMNNLCCVTKPPTMAELKQAMYKRRGHAVIAALVLYPRMIAEDSDIESLEDCLKIGSTKMDIFKNSRAVKALKKIIPSLLEKGYLE